jgi:hypothetical protein
MLNGIISLPVTAPIILPQKELISEGTVFLHADQLPS